MCKDNCRICRLRKTPKLERVVIAVMFRSLLLDAYGVEIVRVDK